jgi:hypothetical protein
MAGPTNPPELPRRRGRPARTAPSPTSQSTPTLYIVGEVEETGDLVIAATDEPDNTTEVWLACEPDTRTLLADLDDELGEGAIRWATEPDPYPT